MSISLEQVSKYYDGDAAVSDVSVDIGDGELFVLLGPSGSGKSTLLRAIAGLTTIDHGRIVLRGRDVTSINAREREVGFVFQNYALFRHMTIADNIEFALRARHVRAGERRRRRAELLKLVALEGFEGRYPAELSGGQQQRVAVARALAHEPRVLLLDEPFGALDARIRDELRRAIRAIQRTVGITTILVTHDQEEAFSMADRIGVMDRGRLQEVGEPRTLYRHPATRFVATFLGAANLLIGHYDGRDLRLGASGFPVAQWPSGLASGDEAAIVVRPEDVVLATRRDELTSPVIGDGEVSEIQFTGATERLRLALSARETLASALKPGARTIVVEASRSAQDAERNPVTMGQRVWIGFKSVHALPTPISSLRILGASPDVIDRLARSPLVRELCERMHLEPIRYCESAMGGGPLRGLPIIGLDSEYGLSRVTGLLERGARQVLAVRPSAESVSRLLIYVEPTSTARDAALATAASLARHLSVEVAMLVRGEQGSARAARYRDLLDYRNASLRQHGLDIRTEMFSGSLPAAIAGRNGEAEAVVLVLGLTGPVIGDKLRAELSSLISSTPPAALLVVHGRGGRDSCAAVRGPSGQVAAAATRRAQSQ